ncbi:MAG TPA: ATP-binding cassette domain-containing protein, partial [Candidatus Marinimicrobia bacterium]|nr:ATP-binding cassette domain-containing protein [Candidatus Neomarinimicrobiota bacterium]
IANNIAYGQEGISEEKLRAVAEAANALDFIEAQPQGFDTVIGDRGVKLSGGQKQRLAIARALLKNPPILIMDEATSSLDSESEKKVQQAIERLMQDRTVFVIAHRLSTVVNADKIVVLSKGKIVETGTHKELIEKRGHYKQLYEVQFGEIT